MTEEMIRSMVLRHWRTRHRPGPGVSRRDLIAKSAGAVGFLLGAQMLSACGGEVHADGWASASSQDLRRAGPVLPRPLPAGNLGPGLADIARVNDPSVAPGLDASSIFDFEGEVATSVLAGTGTGTDAANPRGHAQNFITDMRLMDGRFIGTDGHQHEGSFGFL